MQTHIAPIKAAGVVDEGGMKSSKSDSKLKLAIKQSNEKLPSLGICETDGNRFAVLLTLTVNVNVIFIERIAPYFLVILNFFQNAAATSHAYSCPSVFPCSAALPIFALNWICPLLILRVASALH
eukprot:scaffold18099_cov67-Skeletonema_dohrnii-CCMP3373.AAC.3